MVDRAHFFSEQTQRVVVIKLLFQTKFIFLITSFLFSFELFALATSQRHGGTGKRKRDIRAQSTNSAVYSKSESTTTRPVLDGKRISQSRRWLSTKGQSKGAHKTKEKIEEEFRKVVGAINETALMRAKWKNVVVHRRRLKHAFEASEGLAVLYSNFTKHTSERQLSQEQRLLQKTRFLVDQKMQSERVVYRRAVRIKRFRVLNKIQLLQDLYSSSRKRKKNLKRTPSDKKYKSYVEVQMNLDFNEIQKVFEASVMPAMTIAEIVKPQLEAIQNGSLPLNTDELDPDTTRLLSIPDMNWEDDRPHSYVPLDSIPNKMEPHKYLDTLKESPLSVVAGYKKEHVISILGHDIVFCGMTQMCVGLRCESSIAPNFTADGNRS